MTGVFLATGCEPAGLYTYWHRLSLAGKRRPEREQLALEKLQAHPPDFVLMEKERASFAPIFGREFGLEIFRWIQQHYHEADRFDNSDGGRWVLLERNDAR
jgi:hypothetical protein